MRRLAIFSFSFGAAALCAALLPLDGTLWLLGALALAALLLVLTNWVKPTKKLHPIVFIVLSAVVGVAFHFAGV